MRKRMWASMYTAIFAGVSWVDVDRRLGCRAIVAVVEPADVRRHDDSPDRRRHDRARDRRVLLQCQVRSVREGTGSGMPQFSYAVLTHQPAPGLPIVRPLHPGSQDTVRGTRLGPPDKNV